MKTGDKVIVPAEINGYGRDLRAIVTEIEKFAGAIFVTVMFYQFHKQGFCSLFLDTGDK